MATQTCYHTSWQVVLGSPWRDNQKGWGWTLEAILCPERKAVLQFQVLRGSTSCFFFSPGKSKSLAFLTREYNILNSALIQEKKGRKKREEIERWMGERENTQAYQTKWNMARACHLLFKGSREMPHVFLSLPCLLSPNSPSFLAFQKEMTTRMCH